MAPINFPLVAGNFPRYYDLLEIQQNASAKEIVTAYRKMQLLNHPDKAGNAPEQVEKAQAINAAKEVLTDTENRVVYDCKLAAEDGKSQPRPAFASTPFGTGSGWGPEKTKQEVPRPLPVCPACGSCLCFGAQKPLGPTYPCQNVPPPPPPQKKQEAEDMSQYFDFDRYERQGAGFRWNSGR